MPAGLPSLHAGAVALGCGYVADVSRVILHFGLGFPLPLAACLSLIGFSGGAETSPSAPLSASHRLHDDTATGLSPSDQSCNCNGADALPHLGCRPFRPCSAPRLISATARPLARCFWDCWPWPAHPCGFAHSAACLELCETCGCLFSYINGTWRHPARPGLHRV